MLVYALTSNCHHSQTINFLDGWYFYNYNLNSKSIGSMCFLLPQVDLHTPLKTLYLMIYVEHVLIVSMAEA